MRKHRPFVKRDIIWKWNSHGAQILSAVFKIQFSPLTRPTTIIFSLHTYTWMEIFDDDYSFCCHDSRCLFSFFFHFLPSFFLFIFLTVVSKSTIDSTGTTVDACTECLGFVPSRKRDVVRASTRFSSIFEFDDRDSYPRLFIATLATKTCCFFSVWLSAANYVDCTRATNRSQHRNAAIWR